MLVVINEAKFSRITPEAIYRADMIIVLCDDGQYYRIAKGRSGSSDGTERFPLTSPGQAVQKMTDRRWFA